MKCGDEYGCSLKDHFFINAMLSMPIWGLETFFSQQKKTPNMNEFRKASIWVKLINKLPGAQEKVFSVLSARLVH